MMKKKYNAADVVELVNKAFKKFEKDRNSCSDETGEKIDDTFDILFSLFEMGLLSELMTILREDCKEEK